MPAPQTVAFLGLRLAAVTTAEFIDFVIEAAKNRTRSTSATGSTANPATPTTIGYLNAANVNLVYESAEAAEAFARLDILYADGMAVVWAARRLGAPVPERINAGDFSEEFFRACAANDVSVGLLGGYPGDAERFADRLRDRIDGLKITFIHDGFFSADNADRASQADATSHETAQTVASDLEAADPDIVLIGMGAPRQERLALEWSARAQDLGQRRGQPRVWWCVGALFEYDSGRRRRAPRWVRRIGMEWLVRLALEPARLWRRYLIGNPKFIWRAMRGRASGLLPRVQDKGE